MPVSSQPVGTFSLVNRDIRLVLQRKANIVKASYQAVSLKIIYRKSGGELLRISDQPLLKIDSEFVSFDLARPLQNRSYFVLHQSNRQQTILETIVGENVGE